MRSGEDFDAYVAARWPELVRTVALLGCPDALAPDVVADALARRRGSWARTRGESDVEVAVQIEVADAWARRRRTAWWVGLPASEDPRRTEAEAVLETLDPAQRAAAVLTAVGGLAEHQVAEVVDGAQQSSSPVPDQLLQQAAATVAVPPPPVAALAARADALRRRRRLVAAGGTTAVLAVGVLVWSAAPGGPPTDPDPTGGPDARSATNPAAVPWYADGVLHLAKVEVGVAPLRDLVVTGDGVVGVDLAGRVWSVDATGSRQELGQTYLNVDLVASPADGRVAWADVQRRQLVVVDVRTGRTTATVSGQVRVPIALDGPTLVLRGPDGTTALHQRTGVEEPVGEVVDARSGTWVVKDGSHAVEVTGPDGSARTFAAESARLSPDGHFLLTHTGPERTVHVYDVRTGRELPSGVAADEVALDSELGPERTVAHLVGPAVEREAGEYARLSDAGSVTLRTCRLLTGQCQTQAIVDGSGPSPLLAH